MCLGAGQRIAQPVTSVGMDAPILTPVALDACDMLHIGRGKLLNNYFK